MRVVKWCFLTEPDPVAPLYVKYMRREGHSAHCLLDTPYDPYGMADVYAEYMDARHAIGTMWLKRFPRAKHCLALMRNAVLGLLPITGRRGEIVRDADVIFLSGRHYIFDRLHRLYPRKKIILHYRGTELRTARGAAAAAQQGRERSAHAVTCSTPDLLPILKRRPCADKASWLPNPIDTEMFGAASSSSSSAPSPADPDGPHPTRPPRALRILNPSNHEPTVEELCRRHIPDGMPVTVHQRTAGYADMPALFAGYTHYIDWCVVPKGGVPNPAWSNTGLQALAAGLHVYGHDMASHPPRDFPARHRPEVAARMLLDLA